MRIINTSKVKVKVKSLGRVRLFATSWSVAYKALMSLGFSRQEYWGGLAFPSPGYLPNPGIEPESLALKADSLPSESPGSLLLILVILSNSKRFLISFAYN